MRYKAVFVESDQVGEKKRRKTFGGGAIYARNAAQYYAEANGLTLVDLVPYVNKRDAAFNEVKERAKRVAYSIGRDDGIGFNHAFLWATVTIGKYTRRELITCSESFGNWPEVEAAVSKIPEVKNTWINLD